MVGATALQHDDMDVAAAAAVVGVAAAVAADAGTDLLRCSWHTDWHC